MTGHPRSVRSCAESGDVGRVAVYACELAAFDGTDLEDARSFEEVEQIIRTIALGPWWRGRAVSVRRARAGTASSVAAGAIGRAGAPVEIRLADGQCTVATAAHELAHALAGVEHGHDDVFRQAYLDVVAMGTNLDPLDRRGTTHVDQLAGAFASAGLAVAERRWPPPDAGTVGAIAL
jgi:hypothetical protein